MNNKSWGQYGPFSFDTDANGNYFIIRHVIKFLR